MIETLDLFSHAIDKRIQIKTDFAARKPIINGDKTLLQSAFLNLCLNAADALDEGGALSVTTCNVISREDLYLKMQEDILDDCYLKLSITDSGKGIPEDILAKIFEPFFTTKPVGKGTGMGLAAVYGAVKQHAGFISVESEQGRGACFTLYFPVEHARGNVKHTTRPHVGQSSQSSQRPLTILVVDDEIFIRDMCVEFLQSFGHSVLSAENGKEAVALYRDTWQDIDVVILDLMMPVMGGEEAFKLIKQVNPDAKVLISSGYDSDNVVSGIIKEGVIGVIEKPFRLDALLALIEEAVYI
ncbi:response regulator [Alteromonas facilis]|uniref:response regulator n=1 Tax=Alteromonas facilis TaxID=2048004 RepID=UPI000C29185B|nr:response regulator [Alteromonas facilis]